MKLQLEVHVLDDAGGTSCAKTGAHEDDSSAWNYEYSADQYSDTRRAIVRAAAEIGGMR